MVIDTGETNEQCQFYQDKIAIYDPFLDHTRTAHALLLAAVAEAEVAEVAKTEVSEAEVAELADVAGAKVSEVASPENEFRVTTVQPNQEAMQEHAIPLPIPLEPALSRSGDLLLRPPELAQHMMSVHPGTLQDTGPLQCQR